MANSMLDEFARLTEEKTVTIEGERNIEIGNTVTVSSAYWSGNGMVTSVGSSMSKDGLITIIKLDERCPRLFLYYSSPDYVYVGTDGAGVWRKELDTSMWESVCTGLEYFDIKDLIIKNSIFACVAGHFAYVNTNPTTPTWNVYVQVIYLDKFSETLPSGDGNYKGNVLYLNV